MEIEMARRLLLSSVINGTDGPVIFTYGDHPEWTFTVPAKFYVDVSSFYDEVAFPWVGNEGDMHKSYRFIPYRKGGSKVSYHVFQEFNSPGVDEIKVSSDGKYSSSTNLLTPVSFTDRLSIFVWPDSIEAINLTCKAGADAGAARVRELHHGPTGSQAW
ncbi:hypothetical protein [Streptomyces sp. NPDC057418]|uniref:hypothetical protein n=1 Tax=Streptomyces sp. NPDC057418 TaxID=3346126 RepID=UPI0036BD6F26